MARRTKHLLIGTSVLLVVSAAGAMRFGFRTSTHEKTGWREIRVEEGPFRLTVSSTASIQPENRIVVTPPVPGRLEKVLIEEGERVKAGQVLAVMSSTDRAALMDAARAQGEKALSEWSETYKATAILAPVSGRVIARHIVQGQTVTAETKLFEISDRLVVRAQVDETDVGKIGLGQKASVKIDAFPEKSFLATVARIGHQSVLVNSISTYEVLLAGSSLPEEMRSGMTATVDFILTEKPRALLLPTWIAGGVQNQEIDLTIASGDGQTILRKVRIGSSDGERVEVLGGLELNQAVLYKPVDVSSQNRSGGPLGLFSGAKAEKKK